jgi:hypothetical protein
MMTDPDFVRGFSVRRPTLAVADEGVASYSYETLNLQGIVQPARPNDLQLLPEGSRLKEIISVWCGCELFAADGDATESDVITVDKKAYRVIKSEPWADNGYFRVFAEGFVP